MTPKRNTKERKSVFRKEGRYQVGMLCHRKEGSEFGRYGIYQPDMNSKSLPRAPERAEISYKEWNSERYKQHE